MIKGLLCMDIVKNRCVGWKPWEVFEQLGVRCRGFVNDIGMLKSKLDLSLYSVGV